MNEQTNGLTTSSHKAFPLETGVKVMIFYCTLKKKTTAQLQFLASSWLHPGTAHLRLPKLLAELGWG